MLPIKEVLEIRRVAIQLEKIGFTASREMRQQHRGARFHCEARAVENVAADVSHAAGAGVAGYYHVVSWGPVLAEVGEGWEVEGVGDLVGEEVGDEGAAAVAAAVMLSKRGEKAAVSGGAVVERDVVEGDEGDEEGEDAGFEREAA